MTTSFSHDDTPQVQEKCRQDDLDSDTSLVLAEIIDAQPNTCFDNVLDMLKLFPQISAYGWFVEGWYVVDLADEVVVNEHGWYELPNGRILDPTVEILVPSGRPVYYFTGVKRSWKQVRAILRKKGDIWFPYVRAVGTYGNDGLKHPTYKAAHDAALQKVYSLASTTHPPKKMTFLTAQDLLSMQEHTGISVQILIISAEEGKNNLHNT